MGEWKMVYENVLGEFVLTLLFQEFLEKGIALSASKGWDGDLVKLMEDSDGREALMLDTVWDSDRDADQFQTAYLSLLKKKLPNLRLADSDPQILDQTLEKTQSWVSAEFVVVATSAANRVVFVEMDR